MEEGETVVEVSTDKVDAEVPAPASGTITKIHAQPDETVKVGQVLAEMRGRRQGDGRRLATKPRCKTAEPAAPTAPATRRQRRRSRGCRRMVPEVRPPVARRIAAASGVDLSTVQGSGPGGKVTKADVLAAADGDGRRRGGAPTQRRARRSPCAVRPGCWPRR